MSRRQNGVACLEDTSKDTGLLAEHRPDMIQTTPFSARDRCGAVLVEHLKEKQS